MEDGQRESEDGGEDEMIEASRPILAGFEVQGVHGSSDLPYFVIHARCSLIPNRVWEVLQWCSIPGTYRKWSLEGEGL